MSTFSFIGVIILRLLLLRIIILLKFIIFFLLMYVHSHVLRINKSTNHDVVSFENFVFIFTFRKSVSGSWTWLVSLQWNFTHMVQIHSFFYHFHFRIDVVHKMSIFRWIYTYSTEFYLNEAVSSILIVLFLFQNSMDLPPDKAKLLKNYDDEKKWDIICDQVTITLINISS